MEITFDPKKSERNLCERGLSFEKAAEFDFSTALYTPATRIEYGEARTQAVGVIGDTLHSLVFTMRGTALRVISLRRASRKERKRYANARS